MTDKPTPKEIDDLFVEETGFDTDDFPAAIFGFARAVLAKWGQPAQAAEPVAAVVPCYTPSGKRVALCSAKQDLPIGTKLYAAPQPTQLQAGVGEPVAVIEFTDGVKEPRIMSWNALPAGQHCVYTTPQPTQAQAGAVTDAQVLAAVRVVSPNLFRHGLQPLPHDGANTAARMRKEADTVRKMLEAANGTKGGQHGTE